MALGILNNIPSLMAQNQLAVTNANLQNTLYQLASGSRINSGADDAAGLSIANGLQANIIALQQSETNANNAIGDLQTADGALGQVTNLLNRAVTLATEAGNTGLTGTQPLALDNEYQSIQTEINRIGTYTTFNGNQVFTSNAVGAFMSDGTTSGQPAAISVTPGQLSSTTLLLSGAASGTLTAISNFTANDTVSIGGQTFKFVSSGSIQGDTTAGDVGLGSTTAASLQNLYNAINNGPGGVGSGTQVYVAQAPTGVSATGLTASTLTVTATTGGSAGNNIAVTSSDTSVATWSGTTGKLSGGSAGANLQTTAGAATALEAINSAIALVAAQRGTIGAGINQLTAAVNVAGVQVQNLTSAENGVTAADVPTLVANLNKYNILEQTGIAALAQANTNQQAVLKLLG
jgi:flagellin